MRYVLIAFVLCFLPATDALADGCARAKWALQQASALRHLAIKAPVGCSVLQQKEYFEYLTALLEKDLTPKRLAAEEQVFKLLGLIPEFFPYARCLVKSYSHEAAAFYSAEKKRFIMPAWIPAADTVLVHEATHALQDQHFDLVAIDRSHTIVGDRALAVGALVEGDAMVTEAEFNSNAKTAHTGEEPDERYRIATEPECNLPPLLQDLFYFEYTYGQLFIEKIKAHLNVDDVFRAPPLTTATILHPEKYGLHGQWSNLAIPPPPYGVSNHSLKLIYTERLGEFVVRTLLKQFASPKTAVLGAGGWAGDRIALYEDKDGTRPLLVWHLRFDSDGNSQRFFAAQKIWLAKRFGVELPETGDAFWAGNSTAFKFGSARKGCDVTLFIQAAKPN